MQRMSAVMSAVALPRQLCPRRPAPKNGASQGNGGPRAWGPRWRWRPRWRWQRGIVAATIALLLGSLATHHPIADGPLPAYAFRLLLVAATAGGLWALLAVQLGARALGPLLGALLVVAAAAGLHLVRRASPLARGAPVVAIHSRFDDPAGWQDTWDVVTTGGGTVAQTAPGLRLESVPGGAAYVIARINAPRTLPIAWWMPVAAVDLARVDEVTWQAAVARRGGYTGIFQSRRLAVQAVAAGILIVAPNARGDVDATLVHETAALDGQPHDWRLLANGQTIKLAIDGRPIWSAPQHEPVDEVRLGDARADPEHSGVVTLFQAAYQRRYVPRAADAPAAVAGEPPPEAAPRPRAGGTANGPV